MIGPRVGRVGVVQKVIFPVVGVRSVAGDCRWWYSEDFPRRPGRVLTAIWSAGVHEMAIATGLLRQVLAAAEAHDVECVEEVHVTCGVLRLVVPEALRAAFEVLSEGTVAAGARLEVTVEPAKARCRRCGEVFGVGVSRFTCPGCGQADVDIVDGDDIVLTSIVCREGQGASTG